MVGSTARTTNTFVLYVRTYVRTTVVIVSTVGTLFVHKHSVRTIRTRTVLT